MITIDTYIGISWPQQYNPHVNGLVQERCNSPNHRCNAFIWDVVHSHFNKCPKMSALCQIQHMQEQRKMVHVNSQSWLWNVKTLSQRPYLTITFQSFCVMLFNQCKRIQHLWQSKFILQMLNAGSVQHLLNLAYLIAKNIVRHRKYIDGLVALCFVLATSLGPGAAFTNMD